MPVPTQADLLDPIEASLHLGITPELLFAYVRNAPKQRAGDDRRLPVVQDGGTIKFRPEDLEAFDAYLKEPWSLSAADRPPIPSYVIDYLKIEAGGHCARCGRGFKLENAHVQDYASSLSHHHHNLIRLCSQCHDEFDDRRILPRDELQTLKSRLIQRTRERLEAYVYGSLQSASRPSLSTLFVGREDQVAALLLAFKTKRRIGIRGIGGIGKTQLLLHALASLEEDAEVLWISVDGFESAAGLEVALRSVGLGGGSLRRGPAQGDPLSDADFIVFDGIEAVPPEELEKVEEVLAAANAPSPKARFVFTSQVELHWLDLDFDLELEPLSEAASLEVLTGASGSNREYLENESAQAEWLLSFSAGHPLSLRIIGGLVNFFKSAETVARRLQESGAQQLVNPTRKQQTKATSLEVCLAAAYQALTPAQKRLLFVISHCPAGCYAAILRSWHDLGVEDLSFTMAEVGRWHLVSTEGRGQSFERLFMLSPVRSYFQQALPKEDNASAEELTFALVHKIATWAYYLDIEHIQAGDVAHGMARFTEEFANFNHVFDLSVAHGKDNVEYLTETAMLASALQVFCFLSGLSRRGIEIMRRGAEAAIGIGDIRLATDTLLHLQSLAHRVGDRDEIKRSADAIDQLAQGSTDPNVIGNAAMARGVLANCLDQPEEAEREFERACNQYEKSQVGDVPEDAPAWVKSNDRMLALALMERASIFEHSSRADQALPIYERALGLMVKTQDAVNYGAVLHQMGNCYCYLRQLDRAYESYLDAAKRFADISAAIHFSNSISEIGFVLLDYQPDAELAAEFPREVLEYGLYDVLDECVAALTSDVFSAQECIRLVRKIFGVAILVSFSPHNGLLGTFVEEMRELVLRPVLAFDEGRHLRENGVPLMHLDVTLALIGSVSGSAQTPGSIAVLDEIAHLAALCYRQYDYAWRIFRLFDWLALYLGRYRERPGITADQLRAAAEQTAEHGLPFALDGIAL